MTHNWVLFAVNFLGNTAMFGYFFTSGVTRKRCAALVAIACTVVAILNWLGHQWFWFWLCSAGAGSWAWLWWQAGGDDDWRKRRRQIRDWARSHIPRPVVVKIRTLAVQP